MLCENNQLLSFNTASLSILILTHDGVLTLYFLLHIPSRFSSRLAVSPILQRSRQRFSPNQLLRFVSSQPLPSTGAVSAAHGHHQQPDALLSLRHGRPVLLLLLLHLIFLSLPGHEHEHEHEHEHGVSARPAAVSVVLPVSVSAGVEQSKQQDEQHREPALQGQTARSLARIGNAAQLTSDQLRLYRYQN